MNRWFLRLEYTTFRIPAELIGYFCVDNPKCPLCGGPPGSGSGTAPGTPCDSCTNPMPAWYVEAVRLGGTTATQAEWAAYCNDHCGSEGFGTFPSDCSGLVPSDDLSIVPDWFLPLLVGTTGGSNSQWISTCNFVNSPAGQGTPSLVLELTKFRVPDTITKVSTRCVDIPVACAGACP